MALQKLVGPGAGARKYDLLTALTVSGLAGTPGHTTSMMRLVSLITARYNWRLDEVTIGQAELARMWSVNVRTAKREVKRLRESGLLLVKRPGARGRVATYTLDHVNVQVITRDVWPLVGTDFAERMAESAPLPPAMERTIIPFPAHPTNVAEHVAPQDSGLWATAQIDLSLTEKERFRAWFAPLKEVSLEGSVLTLQAPSGFHANYVTTHLMDPLIRSVRAMAPGVTRVIVSTQA